MFDQYLTFNIVWQRKWSKTISFIQWYVHWALGNKSEKKTKHKKDLQYMHRCVDSLILCIIIKLLVSATVTK